MARVGKLVWFGSVDLFIDRMISLPVWIWWRGVGGGGLPWMKPFCCSSCSCCYWYWCCCCLPQPESQLAGCCVSKPDTGTIIDVFVYLKGIIAQNSCEMEKTRRKVVGRHAIRHANRQEQNAKGTRHAAVRSGVLRGCGFDSRRREVVWRGKLLELVTWSPSSEKPVAWFDPTKCWRVRWLGFNWAAHGAELCVVWGIESTRLWL